ncbi:hypothetical protein [Chthoniobacter flavus]|uniref:hypothetical protein n=1 Tax=Chthoniobacter flavus TaxID=191863 RepID=UPI0012FB5A2F|nr:hypothetical protein [Chthoniobacter flavus]
MLLSGEEIQNADKSSRASWLKWCEAPGRTVLLMPPFRADIVCDPGGWRARLINKVGALLGTPPKIVQFVLNETRHRLEGQLQGAPDLGETIDGSLTQFHRAHPHSGVFAITALPLWSLALLDHSGLLRDWLVALHRLAGEARTPAPTPAAFSIRSEHYSILLHLLSRTFQSRREALDALGWSPIFDVSPDKAACALDQLEREDLAHNGNITERGRALLFASPYAVYARELQPTP